MNKLYINTIFIFICFVFLTRVTAPLFMLNVFCLLFVYIVYNIIYIWKNTWCCIILVSETKDWRLFELFLFKFLLSVCCCHTRHTYVCVRVRQVELCFYCGLFYFVYYLHKVLLIRFYTSVSEWDDASVFVCVCLIDLTKKLNK